MTTRDAQDPERVRVEELLQRVSDGSVTDAEREELALYRDASDLPARVTQDREKAALSQGWLTRLEADDKLTAVERSPMTRVERLAGLGLLLGGFALSFVAPLVGSGMTVAGVVLLGISFARTKLLTLGKDPYRDVER